MGGQERGQAAMGFASLKEENDDVINILYKKSLQTRLTSTWIKKKKKKSTNT